MIFFFFLRAYALECICIKLQPFSQNDKGNYFVLIFLIYVITFDGIGQAFYKMLSHPSFKNSKE